MPKEKENKDDKEYKPPGRISRLFNKNTTRSSTTSLNRYSPYRQVNPEPAEGARAAATLQYNNPTTSEDEGEFAYLPAVAAADYLSDQTSEDELNMSSEQAINSMREAFAEVALAAKQNDLRTVTELPYFGSVTGTHTKNWVVESCEEFLSHIEKATSDDAWNDKGRIKVLRGRLLGPALEYFNDFSGATWNGAKEFLLKMFHDPTTYASITSELEKLKRKPGEQIPYFAIRIAKLYSKLKRVSTADLTEAWIEKSKKEMLLKHLPGAVRNFVKVDVDTYDIMLKSILDYMETNIQHRLTRADIEGEKEKGIKGINNLNKDQGGKGNQKSGQNKPNLTEKTNPGKEENVVESGSAESGLGIANINNKSANPNQNPNPNKDQGQGQGQGRGGGHGGGRGRDWGRGRGGYRGRGGGRGSQGGRRDNRNVGYDNYANNQGSEAPRDYSNYKCYNCNRWGHIAADCRSPSNREQRDPLSQGSNQGGGRQLRCYNCNGANHKADACHAPRRNFRN